MRIYYGKRGQRLTQIAKENGITYRALRATNLSLFQNTLSRDTSLLIPLPAPKAKGNSIAHEKTCAITTCSFMNTAFHGSSLIKHAENMTFCTVLQNRECEEKYILPKPSCCQKKLREKGVIPLLFLPFSTYLYADTFPLNKVHAYGYRGVLLALSSVSKSILPLLKKHLCEIRSVGLITCLSLPFSGVQHLTATLSWIDGLYDFCFLQLPFDENLPSIIEDITDILPPKIRMRLLLGCQGNKKSHVLQHGFLDLLLPCFERIAHGCFAGIHFPANCVPPEFYTCLTDCFQVQQGYETILPHSHR